MYDGWGWRPYVSVAERRLQALREMDKRRKKRHVISPVTVEGRTIVKTFWGKSWCDNLERYSDFSNRLPRGRTYVRNGSVVDLQISAGKIKALVSGSELYTVTVSIKTLKGKVWKCIKQDCSQSIASLIDLLQGRFEEGVMQRLTCSDGGLFPKPAEIVMGCSCPDYAGLCKHVAAVLYGVGSRLDASPELLFTLRAVDHLELIGQAVAAENLERTLAAAHEGSLAGSDLGELFGIEIESAEADSAKAKPATRAQRAEVTGKSKRARARNAAVTVTAAQPALVKRARKSSKARGKRKSLSPRRAKAKPTLVSATRSK